MTTHTTGAAPDQLLEAKKAANPVHQVFNDRGHTSGWKCSACGRFSGYKSTLVHLEDCVHARWRASPTSPAPEYAEPYKPQLYAAAYAPEAVDKIRKALEFCKREFAAIQAEEETYIENVVFDTITDALALLPTLAAAQEAKECPECGPAGVGWQPCAECQKRIEAVDAPKAWASLTRTAMTQDKRERLEAALNPRMWSKEMHDAWHKALPDMNAAFAAIRELAAVERRKGE